jgi:hypothetical protein
MDQKNDQNAILDFGVKPYSEKVNVNDLINHTLSFCLQVKPSRKIKTLKEKTNRPPMQIVIMLDTSASMNFEINGYSRLKKACHGIRIILNHLNDKDNLWIITFNGSYQVHSFMDAQGLIRKNEVVKFLSNPPRGSGTSFYPPMKEASDILSKVKTPGVTQLVLVLTDGEPNSARYTSNDILDLYDEVSRMGPTWIFAGVGLLEDGEIFLKELGGRYFISLDSIGVENFFLYGIAHLALSVAQNLRVKFEPSKQLPSSSVKLRHLEFVMNGFDKLEYERAKSGELFLGNICESDFFRCYLEVQTRLAIFTHGTTEIGNLVLTADINSIENAIRIVAPLNVNIGNSTVNDNMEILSILKGSAEIARELYWLSVGRGGGSLEKATNLLKAMPNHEFTSVMKNVTTEVIKSKTEDSSKLCRTSLSTMGQNMDKTILNWTNPTTRDEE